jgi:hypothetical protein
MPFYDDDSFYDDELICKEFLSNDSELAAIPWMAEIAVVEILLIVRKEA